MPECITKNDLIGTLIPTLVGTKHDQLGTLSPTLVGTKPDQLGTISPTLIGTNARLRSANSQISLTLPQPPALSPAEIVLPVKIWHHTFTAHMANQIKRRNVSSLTYKNFLAAQSAPIIPHGQPDQAAQRQQLDIQELPRRSPVRIKFMVLVITKWNKLSGVVNWKEKPVDRNAIQMRETVYQDASFCIRNDGVLK
ncbi:hypothetical protein F511_20954 [Dorcoceras hygrometricum]|uniref:Uncharacterized protein n=1 Tax=Dorcoceras hygrometricum TaxID=472368 RepID=A0A2Z7BGU8_9LAMI|nr:hypothetical protein F511_20954 [Dorcoceras hygrometricum]